MIAHPEQVEHWNGLLTVEELAVLSDGSPWIRNACEEILAGRKVTYIFNQFHALEYAAAVQALTQDKGEHKTYRPASGKVFLNGLMVGKEDWSLGVS